MNHIKLTIHDIFSSFMVLFSKMFSLLNNSYFLDDAGGLRVPCFCSLAKTVYFYRLWLNTSLFVQLSKIPTILLNKPNHL